MNTFVFKLSAVLFYIFAAFDLIFIRKTDGSNIEVLLFSCTMSLFAIFNILVMIYYKIKS